MVEGRSADLLLVQGKVAEFQAGFSKFYEATKAGQGGAGGCLYYGFAVAESTIYCREGYKVPGTVR